MEIHEALCAAQEQSGWDITRLAYEIGVTSATVYHWKSGKKIPGGEKMELLRAKLPAFRELMDKRSAPIRKQYAA